MSANDIILDIPNFCTPASGLCTGGRPQPEQLAKAAEQGIKMVVNFCPPGETPGYDEGAVVKELGMSYHNIPVGGAADLSWAAVDEFTSIMNHADPEHRVLVHCASGNRVGAMFALKAFRSEGKNIDQALEIGRAAGLTGLEPVVEQIMRSHSV